MADESPAAGVQIQHTLASTDRGRIPECVGYPGFIPEYDPVVIRLRSAEFHDIGETIDRLSVAGESACDARGNPDCGCGNFAVRIAGPDTIIEFSRTEAEPLHELFVEARLSLLLRDHSIGRPDSRGDSLKNESRRSAEFAQKSTMRFIWETQSTGHVSYRLTQTNNRHNLQSTRIHAPN